MTGHSPDRENVPVVWTESGGPSSTSPASPAATRARLWIVLAAVLWSTSGFFAKSPAFAEWPESSRGLLLAFWRALFASALLLTMVRRPVWDWRLLVSGALFALMNGCYLTAMVRCEASLAIWLQYSAPLWVAIGSWWLLGEKIPRRQIAPWAISMAGVMVILLFRGVANAPLDGIAIGLFSGVMLAGVVLSLRWMADLDLAWVLVVNHLATALVLSPVLWSEGIWPQASQWWLLIGFGSIQMGLPYLIFARAVRHVSANEASAILLLEPVILPVWVWLAWRSAPDYSPPALVTLIGGGMIVAGLALRYRLHTSARNRFRQDAPPANGTAA